MNVFFPVETINRELDWRLMMAARLAGPGRRIFVGQHDFLERVVDSARGGVYVGKNVFKSLFPDVSMSRRDRLVRAGIRIVHLDEEGAFFFNGQDEWRRALDRRLEPESLPVESILCTWGAFQATHYREFAEGSEVVVTGHPRFDLYKPQYRDYWRRDVERIRRDYGDFVLVNTNLSLANNAFGIQDIFSGRMGNTSKTEKGRLQSVQRFAHQRRVHAALVEALAHLANQLPDLSIVVRPHPAEDFTAYQAVFSAFPNVHVIHEGPVSPWILAARAVIHDGCTTAIEAHIAGVPVLNFHPVKGGVEVTIPNLVGVVCTSEPELVEGVMSVLDGSYRPRALRSKMAHEMFSNFKNDSFEPFAQVLEQVIAEQPWSSSFDRFGLQKALIGHRLHRAPRDLVRPFFPAKHRAHNAYLQAFPGFESADISERINACEQVLDKQVNYEYVSAELVVFES